MHFDFLTAAGLFASVARRQALDPDFPMNMNFSTCALALGFNQLTGEIPAKIGQMTSLQRLVLFVNQLTGAIPTELSQLNNLYYLQLGGNQLTGTVPKEVRNDDPLRFAASDDGAACGLRRTGPPRGDACRQVIVYRSRDVSPKRLYYGRFGRLR
jgi:hypothetical protein